MKKNKIDIIAVCAFLACVSIGIRLPSILLESPADYEWHSATVLRHLQIWYADGALEHNFVPPVSYAGDANKHIDNHSSIEKGRMGYARPDGTFYYVSYPPLSYIAPYMSFTLLGIEPNIIGVRLFNVLVQVATASVLFALVYRVTRNSFASVVGYALYLFAPITLYMHAINYMADMFVQLFFALCAYWFFVIIDTKHASVQRVRYVYAALGVSLGLMVYTEWLGLFVALFLIVYSLYHRTAPYAKTLIGLGIGVPLCVLAFLVLQYASVADLQTFVAVMVDRYVYGYTPDAETQNALQQLFVVVQRYVKWYWPFIITAPVLLGVVYYLRAFLHATRSGFSRVLPLLLFLAVPPVLHHLVFLNWTAFNIHFFAVLKSALFVSVFTALCVHAIWTYRAKKIPVRLLRGATVLLLVGLVIASYSIYNAEMHIHPKTYSTARCDVGRQIDTQTGSNEVAFLRPQSQERFNNIISAVLIACAERNVALYTDHEHTQALLRKNGVQSGVVFTIDYVNNIIELVGAERVFASSVEIKP